jgi:hypothetical protein
MALASGLMRVYSSDRDMGNFYANISLDTTDIDAVAGAIARLDRQAYVARDARATYVFDERCDEQDLDELERLATALSKDLGCVALAACNHDDDALVILLAKGGALIDRYDSTPGFDDTPGPPSGGDAARLCAAFGVPDQRRAVGALLRRSHEQIAMEVDRHVALCRLFGLSARMSVLGYRYVDRGELVESAELPTLRLVARTAPAADRRSDRSPQTTATPGGLEGVDHDLMAAMQAEGKDLFWNNYALALSDAEVPERFVPLFGIARGNGHLLLTRLLQYVVARSLVKGVWVHADALLAECLGEGRYMHVATARLLRTALRIPPLSESQIAAFNSGDVEFLGRIAQAFEAAQHDADEWPTIRCEIDD